MHVARHLGDALRVVRDRAEGIHCHNDSDGRQQSAAGEGDGEQADDPGAAEQESPVNGRGNHDGGVDRRFQPDGDAGEDHGCRARERRLAHIVDRTILGAGVVTGEAEDEDCQHDSDDDRTDGDDARIVDESMLHVSRQVKCCEGGWQVREGGDCHKHRGNGGRHIKGAIDGLQAVLAGPRPGQEDTDDGGDHPNCGDYQREDQAGFTKGRLATNEGGDQRHGVRLEEIGCHAGAVADVIADIVRNRRGIAGVVFGNALLHLADQVGADIGGLGEYAAAYAHEHGEHRGPEAEALEDRRGVTSEDENH